MNIDRAQLQKDIHALYANEHVSLGTQGTYALLEKGRDFDLSATLAAGGVGVFPHAGVIDCGHQIAACVHACMDSGADKVVVISVLHAFTDDMQAARVAVSSGDSPSNWKYWGIQGPGIENGRKEWLADHALISFRHFWQAEMKRRGGKAPRVYERYPYLAGGKPENLPGIDELARLAEDAVIVSTADPFHHGIGYGDPPERSFAPEEGGLRRARRSIEEGIRLLENWDYWGYDQHCVRAKSDARDAGQVFTYLRGPMKGRVLDLTYSLADALYQAPPPTWVAAALIEWQPAR